MFRSFKLVNNDTKIRDLTDMNYMLQVDHLKPGTSYSFRLRIIPFAVELPPPSEIAVFSTLSAAPSQPSSPILVSRARTSLKVPARLLQSFRFSGYLT